MTVDDLAAFLAARYDEAEAATRLAAREGSSWKQDDPLRHPGAISSTGGPVVYDEGSPDEHQAAHIAATDPAHRLADIKLKRAILAEHEHVTADTPAYRKGPESFDCATCDHIPDEGTYGGAWCATVRQLGTEFAGHPQYRQEWAP